MLCRLQKGLGFPVANGGPPACSLSIFDLRVFVEQTASIGEGPGPDDQSSTTREPVEVRRAERVNGTLFSTADDQECVEAS